jgi:hypothetical protein
MAGGALTSASASQPDDMWDDPRLGRLAGALGVSSLLLLIAAFFWAHHRGPRADSIVALWLLSTAATFVVAHRALEWRNAAMGPLAYTGRLLAIVSVLVLIGVGVASAAGVDPGSYCGGG